jgi:tetratricopeptide (TPR) repeat protein
VSGRPAACLCAGLVFLLASCASAFRSGQSALREGHYPEAAARFGEALAKDPAPTEARFGLGLAHYRMGAIDAAVGALDRVVLATPDLAEARLYLGLAHLGLGDQDEAARQLGALMELDVHPRFAAQADRALGLMRGGTLPVEVRDFVRQSLEDGAMWYQDVLEARLAPHLYFGPLWYVRDPEDWSPLGWRP